MAVEGDSTTEGNNLARFEGGIFMGSDRTTNVVGRHVFYDGSVFDWDLFNPNCPRRLHHGHRGWLKQPRRFSECGEAHEAHAIVRFPQPAAR
ncbi:MAG: hypothetical protein JXB62_21565 [Pirellulales bacterium]|nr:hypothetical protein [Pirellulales bacterium]